MKSVPQEINSKIVFECGSKQYDVVHYMPQMCEGLDSISDIAKQKKVF